MSRMIAAARSLFVPMTTRSGRRKSPIADPSRRNSGFDTMSNSTGPTVFCSRRSRSHAPVPTGTVLFVTMTRYSTRWGAMAAATAEICERSASPFVPSGVPTAMKMTVDVRTASARSVEKRKRRTAALRDTTSASPGSKNGIVPARSASIRETSVSTHTTEWPKSARHAPVTSPTYPVPTIAIFIGLRTLRLSPAGAPRGCLVVWPALPLVRQRERDPVLLGRRRGAPAQQGGNGPELEVGQQCSQASLGLLQIPVMAETTEPPRLQPWLVGIDFPRVDIKHGGLRLHRIQPRDPLSGPLVRKDAEVSPAR